MGKIEYVLCSTFHDPDFRLKDLAESALPKIKKLFVKGIICLTPFTSDEVLAFFESEGFIAKVEPRDRQVDTYKSAIKTTIDNIDDFDSQKIFHIDFDRLLHWIHSYPDELADVLENNSDVEFLHIGRTPRAYSTHPKTQKKTEVIVNEFGSKILGFNETKDIMSLCYILTKNLGERLLRVNNFTTAGFFGSWPIYLWNWAKTKRHIGVEGHEWETPDRFKEEISNIGYEEWIKQFQTADEWHKRVKFLHESLLELAECAKFEFKK